MTNSLYRGAYVSDICCGPFVVMVYLGLAVGLSVAEESTAGNLTYYKIMDILYLT